MGIWIEIQSSFLTEMELYSVLISEGLFEGTWIVKKGEMCMDFNKEKCKTLKQIRKKMADALDIDLHQTECTYEGKCSGTCPKCKQEEQQLNRALLGKTALAAGVVVMSIGLSGCTPDGGELEGDTVSVTTENIEDNLEGEESLPEDLESDEIRNSEDVNSEDEKASSTETPDSTEEEYELEGDVVYIGE